MWTADAAVRSRGNYVVNWGYTDVNQIWPNGDTSPIVYSPWLGPFSMNKCYSAADIKDGLSNTMLMSEVIQAVNDNDGDSRGDFFNDFLGSAQFMTRFTPNSGFDSMLCLGADPNLPAPCTPGTGGQPVCVTARSRHPGGVNAVLGDGSVQFYSDAIDVNLWRALSSKDFGEPVSGNL